LLLPVLSFVSVDVEAPMLNEVLIILANSDGIWKSPSFCICKRVSNAASKLLIFSLKIFVAKVSSNPNAFSCLKDCKN
jgi:hypothetical protein